MHARPETETLLTAADVARWFGVSRAWVIDHATRKQPRLPTIRLGKLLRFHRADLEQFLASAGLRDRAA